MKKYLKVIALVALVAVVFLATDAYAADGAELFGNAQKTLAAVFRNVRQIVFIMGGFALIGFAVAAIFGKLDWKKVAILAVGLALLAVASQVVDYATKAGSDADSLKPGNFSTSEIEEL